MFLIALPGLVTWMISSTEAAGLAGVLFGIFGFNLSIMPFRRPLPWTSIASFCIFDLLWGGIWFGFNYSNKAPMEHFFAWVLANTGLFAGVALGWLYFQYFAEHFDDGTLAEQ